jgi:hypothetical protein
MHFVLTALLAAASLSVGIFRFKAVRKMVSREGSVGCLDAGQIAMRKFDDIAIGLGPKPRDPALLDDRLLRCVSRLVGRFPRGSMQLNRVLEGGVEAGPSARRFLGCLFRNSAIDRAQCFCD